jgi:hypothetical protein
MMFTDKAFSIWMGHAGEDTQVFSQDDASQDVKALERTQVLAITRHAVMAREAAQVSRRQLRDCEPEGIAA